MWYWGGGSNWWMWLPGFVGMVALGGVILWVVWHFIIGGSRLGMSSRNGPAVMA
jgi:hypothetical protein